MRILNFGSLNLDSFYTVDHFVQAGETLSSGKLEKFCGGKGLNQSIALARAGASVWHAGCIGPDGDCLRDILSVSGANTDFVKTVGEVSGHAIIQLDKKGQNCILLYGGANQKIDREQIDSVLENFAAEDILLIQNEINELGYLTRKAAGKGMKIVLNPSPADEKLKEIVLDDITYFILNEIEGRVLTGETGAQEILSAFRQKYPHSVVVLTLGKDGVMYDDGTIRCSHGIYDVPVVDTTGAGDTFTGFFLTAITLGESPQESLRLASVASSLVVSRKGAAPSIPTMAEVRAAKLRLL